MRDILFS